MLDFGKTHTKEAWGMTDQSREGICCHLFAESTRSAKAPLRVTYGLEEHGHEFLFQHPDRATFLGHAGTKLAKIPKPEAVSATSVVLYLTAVGGFA
jgi:hypothetical protein